MATQQTITPTAGHAPFPYEKAIGGGFTGFEAIDFRRFWSRAYAEGVTSGAAWKVSEASGGANLTVEIAADVGPAFVQGDSVADQGLYYVPPHSAGVTLDVPAPDPSNPRADMVVLRVLDDAHDGSGEQEARLEILPGTPTSGATVNNWAGAATVPDSALLLAGYIVAASGTSVSNSDMIDFRDYGLRDARIGEYRMFAADAVPDGFLEADHSAVRRDQFRRLYLGEGPDVGIGTTHGVGDGSLTFNLPDMDNRVPLGRSGTKPLATKGGAETHTLTLAQTPSHFHGLRANGSGGGVGAAVGAVSTALTWEATAYTEPQGSDQPHNNMQPYNAVVMCVFTGSVATPA